MAAGLCWLVDKSGHSLSWVDVINLAPKWLLRARTLAKLAHWGLIEAKPNDDTTKKSSGIWRPTRAGVEVAAGRQRVKKYVFIYNNVVEGFSSEEITIHEALGDQFNYAELMTSTPPVTRHAAKAYYDQFDE